MNVIRKYRNHILSIIILFVFFLLSIGFFNLDMYLSIILFLLLAFLFLLNIKYYFKKLLLIIKDKKVEFAFICVFCFSMFLFSTIWETGNFFQNIFHYLFLPLLFASASFFLYWLNKKYLFYLLLIIFIGFYIQGLLIAGNTFSYSGMFNDTNRVVFDVWTNIPTSCTSMTLYLIPLSSLAIYLLINFKKYKVWCVAGILIILFSSYISVVYQNRSFFVLLLIISIVLILISFSYRSDFSKIIFRLLISIGVLLFLYFILLLLVGNNVFGLAELFSKIPFLYRVFSGGSNNQRISIYLQFFQKIYFIFGGMKLESSPYIHNVWLDVYAIGGLIPCFILVLLTVWMFYFLYKKSKTDNDFIKLAFTFYVGWCGIGLFEPTIFLSHYYFNTFFCFVSIWLLEYEKNKKKRLKNERRKEDVGSDYLEIFI